MNNIKLFMLLIMAATSSVAIADGGTWTFSESNGTLTITASGDLTTASQSTTYKVFTSSAVGNVFTDNTGTNVVQGNAYNAGSTYYEAQSTWTPLFTSNNNVPTTEGNYAYTISETYKWKESTAGATGVYFYAAYLSEETTWSVPEGTYVYKIYEPKQDWVIAENTYVYPITYSPKQWVTENTSGKYIYTAYFDNGVLKSDQGVADTNYDPTAGIYSEGTTYQTWDKIYVYSTESLGSLSYGQEFTIGTESGNVQYVPSDWISETPKIKISGDAVISGNDYPGDGNTFTYNNKAYYYYVTSTTQLSSGTEYTLSSLSGVGLITNMSNYHALSDKVYVHKISQYSNYNVTNTTFNYGGNTYYLFATSSTDKGDGIKVAISDLTMVTDLGALSSYYNSKFKVNFEYNLTRYTNQDYTTRNAITYNGQSYVGYVKLSSAYNSGTTYYVGDQGVSLITESELKSTYLDGTITYYASNNLYRSTDNGTTKTLLTAGQQYTYSTGDTFYTPAATEYVAITNNAEYFGTGGTGESYITDHTETLTFQEALRLKILSGSYTKVEFVNSGSGELTINPAIVQKINFPNNSQNTNLTNLDLGQTTLKLTGEEKFSDIFENPGANYSYSNTLAEVTLPLVSAVGGEVTLPSNAIPSGYNDSQAALRTVNVPTGYTKIGSSAFYQNSGITHVNLPTLLTEIGEMAFMYCSKLQYINSVVDENNNTRSIVLPSALKTIGTMAFIGTKLTSSEKDPFILPSSLETIMPMAFSEVKTLTYLELNENLEFIGNSAFYSSSSIHEQASITFPKSIKYLGPASFFGRRYNDIYFTGTIAPISPLGNCMSNYDYKDVTAFDACIQMGNNGFTPIGVTENGGSSDIAAGSTADNTANGYANRENYVGSGDYYLAILHYPKETLAANAETYKDITREYVTNFVKNQQGELVYAGYGSTMTLDAAKESNKSVFMYYPPHAGDGPWGATTEAKTVNPGFIDTYKGLQQIWPSQSQWMRYFGLVANGYKWDGVTRYEPAVEDWMLEMMEKDVLVIWDAVTAKGSDTHEIYVTKSDYDSKFSDAQKEYLSQILYQGTRRFVLSYDGDYNNPFTITLQGGRWWSICLPFSMTKAEVDKYFKGSGAGDPHVCLMSAIDRIVSTDPNGSNTLVLKFKNDVYRYKTERTGGEITSTGRAYKYASNFKKEDNNAPEDDEIVIYARESYMIYPTIDDKNPSTIKIKNPVFEEGAPLPTMVQVNRENGTFIDGFNQQYKIDGSDPVYRFIGNFTSSTGEYETTKNDNNEDVTAPVAVKIPQYSYAYGRASASETKSKFFILSTAGATWSPFKSIVQNTAVDGGANDWNNFFQKTTARVNQVSLFGDDEEITGIDNVIIEVSSDNDEDLRVFNLNGMQMGNSLQGLPAGTYIQGGKAYRVK